MDKNQFQMRVKLKSGLIGRAGYNCEDTVSKEQYKFLKKSMIIIGIDNYCDPRHAFKCKIKLIFNYGPTQVKFLLWISGIFYVMNLQHFLEMLEFDLWHFLA